MNIEKVIKGLECCLANRHNNCPYKSTDEGIDKVTSCTTYLMKDALALLKEQDAKTGHWNGPECSHCHAILENKWRFFEYCPYCGAKMEGW